MTTAVATSAEPGVGVHDSVVAPYSAAMVGDEPVADWRPDFDAGWVWGTVYRRNESYFMIRGGPRTSSGFRTERRDLPATIVAESEPVEILGEAIFAQLLELDLSPEVLIKNRRFPILRQARASSWLDLVKTSATVGVNRRGAVFSINTWVRDLSRLDGYQIPGDNGNARLEDPTPLDLGIAVRVAADACQP